jgi:hypothetical protein
MDDAIRKALEVAGEAVRQSIIKPPGCMEGTGCELPPCHCSSVAAAAAIAAFLEEFRRQFPQREPWDEATFEPSALAAAVRRAAGGG